MATPLVLRIAKTLQQELDAANCLLALLKQESQLLANRDFKALADIIERKSQQLVNLEQGGLARKKILEEQRQANTDLQWRHLLARSHDTRLQADWQRLEQLVQDCKRENAINGKLLARSQRSVSQLSSLLRGQQPAANLYNQKGNHSGRTQSHTYVQA